MTVLIAPDKFKNSLTAEEVCQALQTGILQNNASTKIITHPMADGGDGSLEVLSQHFDLKTVNHYGQYAQISISYSSLGS